MEQGNVCEQLGSMLHDVADQIIGADEAEQKALVDTLKENPKIQELLAKYKEKTAAKEAADKEN